MSRLSAEVLQHAMEAESDRLFSKTGRALSYARLQTRLAVVLRHIQGVDPGAWLTKGSYALHCRFPDDARAPGDLDIQCLAEQRGEAAFKRLLARLNRRSDLSLSILHAKSSLSPNFDVVRSRFRLTVQTDQGKVDIDVSAGVGGAPAFDSLKDPFPFESLGLPERTFRVPSIEHQVADKCLGLLGLDPSAPEGAHVRGVDLVDLYILSHVASISGGLVSQLVRQKAATEHVILPDHFIGPSQNPRFTVTARAQWLKSADKAMSKAAGSQVLIRNGLLDARTGTGSPTAVLDMEERVASFLSPLLQKQTDTLWLPGIGQWTDALNADAPENIQVNSRSLDDR